MLCTILRNFTSWVTLRWKRHNSFPWWTHGIFLWITSFSKWPTLRNDKQIHSLYDKQKDAPHRFLGFAAYNARFFSAYFTENGQVHSPRMLQNKLKSNCGEHWVSFTELCKPHLAALWKTAFHIFWIRKVVSSNHHLRYKVMHVAASQFSSFIPG